MAVERASDTDCLTQRRAANGFAESAYRGDIDGAPEERLESGFETYQVEQCTAWLECHQKVYVTVRPLFAPRDGAKNSHIVGTPFLSGL